MSGSIQGHGSVPVASRSQPLGDGALRPIQASQKYTGRLANLVGDHRALLQFEIERSANELLRHLEQLLGERYQLFRRQTAMPLIHGLGQRIGNPGANPDHGGLFDAEFHRDGVGGLEANATDIARQPIGVLGHDLDGVGTIGLENPYRPRRADTVAVQEHHDFPHRLLLGPGGENAGGANRPDAIDLAQPVRRCLDDVEHLLAEGPHELLGVDRPNAPDHSGREVLLDAVDRSRGRCAQKAGFELLAVGAIVDPFTRGGDPLTSGNGGGMANHGHDVAMPACLGSQNTEAVFGVVVSDAFDETRQNFLG